jgi:hypothetical protein
MRQATKYCTSVRITAILPHTRTRDLQNTKQVCFPTQMTIGHDGFLVFVSNSSFSYLASRSKQLRSTKYDGGSMFLRNVGICQKVHTALQPRRRTWSLSHGLKRSLTAATDGYSCKMTFELLVFRSHGKTFLREALV